MKDVQLLVLLILGVAVIVSGYPRERDVESVEVDAPVPGVPALAVPNGPAYIPGYFGFLPNFDLMSRIRGLMTRLRSQIGDSFSNIDWTKGNSTSTTKVIDGHVVTVNETLYRDDDSDLVLHVKLIDVKPTEGVEESFEVTSPKEDNGKDVASSATSNEDPEDNSIPNKSEEGVAESLEYKNKPEETRKRQIEIRENVSPDYLYDDRPVEEVNNEIEENKPVAFQPISLHNDILVNKIEDKGEMLALPEDVEIFVPDNKDMYTVNKDNEYVYNPKNMPVYETVPYTKLPDNRDLYIVNRNNDYVYNPKSMPIYETVPYTKLADNRDLYIANRNNDYVYSPKSMPIYETVPYTKLPDNRDLYIFNRNNDYVYNPKSMPIYETVPYTEVPDNRDLYIVNRNNDYVYNPMPIYETVPYLRFQHWPQRKRLASLT